MSGDPLILSRRSRLDNIILVFTGIVGSIVIILIAFSLLEASLARQDRANQEQLIWRCNGNGGADIQCLPYAKA